MIVEQELRIDPETGEILDDIDILTHYGMPRRSGRYPWGSGEDPYQHGSGDFLSRVEKLKAEGKSESEQAKELGIVNYKGEPSPTRLRRQISVASQHRRAIMVEKAKDLKAKGYGNTEIAKMIGAPNESTVRSWLNESSEKRMYAATNTARYLKEEIDKHGMVDVGANVERTLGISRTQLDNALTILEQQGYPLYGGRVPQATNKGMMTTIKAICVPGTEKKDIYKYENIYTLGSKKSSDGGETFDPVWVYPKSLDSKRVQVVYAEDDGVKKDGLVELRRGVDDISLGDSKYAQVRILVDGTHYIKGMAVYADDLPPGVDVRFNTNKHKGTPMLGEDKNNSVLKPIDTKDPNNPFGSLIKEGIVDPDNPGSKNGGQRYYYDKNGEKQLSVINKRSDEGDWGEWAHDLPSQFLSKQNRKLVKQQLDLAKIDKQDEYEEICSLTNPTVKKYFLGEFAKQCDSDAVKLKAAALPRQQYQVILPLVSIKDDEVYAPNYNTGEKVALIRYPHGGKFEIPILTVNNNNKEGISSITPSARDAVGISAKVAGQLSGADFDGDTVMVIPLSGKANISAIDPEKSKAYRELIGFEPKEIYRRNPGDNFKLMTKGGTQAEMGKISNLITDMTIKGADPADIVKAVKHSMVVIDAHKHQLNYKQSEIDNDIQALKNKWQGRYDEDGHYRQGAATIISQATSDARVPKYPGMKKIDPETGKLYWDPNKKPETYIDDKGKVQTRMIKSTKMAETDDAMTLVSEVRSPIELLYADYANSLKGLANDARKEMVHTGRNKKDPEARKKYKDEVDHLLAMLDESERNAPRERAAQYLATSRVKALIAKDDSLSSKEIGKLNQRELAKARAETGAKRTPIKISPEEWKVIQEGAISENELTKILRYADDEEVRNYAMPKNNRELSQSKKQRISLMQDAGFTNSEIANVLGISTSTVQKYLK